MGPYETESFCKAKNPVNRTKGQSTEWEKVISTPISDRVLISKTNKELQKLDFNKPNNPIKKWGIKLKRILKRGISKAEKQRNV